MNWDQIEGNWKQVKGKVKEKWGKLTDDELDVLAGKRDQLVGKIQERYGIAKTEAEGQVEEFRKAYEAVDGLELPPVFVTNEREVEPIPMPGTDNRWVTTRFVDPADLRHDMHVNIVTFEPGAVIPFAETHVMEHGLYVVEGKAVYRLNTDWVEVQEGDFMWLRAFCPQACYAGGPGRFRYLLYKDVNRHSRLSRQFL